MKSHLTSARAKIREATQLLVVALADIESANQAATEDSHVEYLEQARKGCLCARLEALHARNVLGLVKP